ncbi:low affinity immunoglobulin gamma Fc region receptor III-A-like [Taeniopygia guttata]|uniref:low affinity immunoglobulin gamma Fc region receptor III-A-like n=1 Tax=Taeniopygia guttata TaxID=59729 RepID=UPI003BB972AF
MAGDTGMAGKVALLLWAQTLGLAGAQTTQLLVEPPWRPAVLWDRVTLTCQGSGTAGATTWYKDGQRWGQQGHDHITVTESGTYTCDRPSSGHSRHVKVLDDQLVLQVPTRTLLEGDTVTLRCRCRQGNPVSSVFFYHEEKELEFQNGTEVFLSHLQLHHSGRYRCRGWVNSRVAQGWEDSAPVTVTVHVPVANATITLSPLAHQVRAGDPVTLRCSVQVGSAPVTFTWRHNGQEVAQGPLLELGDVNVGHSGTYQCVAANQLDSHQALSPELVLTVTSQGHMDPVVAGIGWALLFLVLLVGVIVAWHRWHRVAARKHQERPSPEPLATPEEGEILYTHVVSTKQAQRPSCITVPQERQVTYTELPGLHGRPCETSDINEIVL